MADEILHIVEEPAQETADPQVGAMAPPPLRIPTTLKNLVEALIFAAREPLSIKQLQALYESQGNDGEERHLDATEVGRLIEQLNADYASAEKPYRIIPIAGGFQFATQPVYAEWLGKLYKEQSRRKLSQSSIESLSIIAYKQPISKPEIESIRGVNCDYVLKTLLEKELVTIVGRAPTPGRPLLYGTTREFLKHFGLNDISDLPRPREIEEILGESQFEAERRMLEAQQGLGEEQKKEEEDFKSRLPHIPKRKATLDETVKIVSKKKSRELMIRTEEQGQEPVSLDQSVSPEAVAEEPVVVAPQESINESPPSDFLKNADSAEKVTSTELTTASSLNEVGEQRGGDAMPERIRPFPAVEKDETAKIGAVEVLPVESEADARSETEQVEQPIGDLLPPSDSDKVRIDPAPSVVEEAMTVAPGRVVEQELPVVELQNEPEPVQLAVEEPVTEVQEVQGTAEDNESPAEIVSGEENQGPLTITPEVHPEPATDQSSEEKAEPGPFVQAPVLESPTSIMPPEIQVTPPFVAPVPEPAGRSQAPHHKTPWQNWKEKIQGFIRKLFG